MDKLVLYFGYGDGGHFLRWPDGTKTSLKPQKHIIGFPWTLEHLDTGLLKNGKVSDNPDGRVFWTCGGSPLWFAFFWWDRSGDSRPGSNSGFYVRGFEIGQEEDAFNYACLQWKGIIKRQSQILILQRKWVPEEKWRAMQK